MECAKAARPDAWTRVRFWSARQPALVTTVLITINVAVFVYTSLRDPSSISGRLSEAHIDLSLYGPFLEQGEWYRLVTSGFLHYGIIHIGFNMYLLYMLGQMLEPAIGRVRFALVYFAGLLGGSAGAAILQPDALSAGASGAVFGLLALAFVGYYLNGTNPMSTSIGSLLLLNLVITFLWRDSISVGGHLGGALAGALCALTVMAPAHKGVPRWATFATPVAVMVVAVGATVLSINR